MRVEASFSFVLFFDFFVTLVGALWLKYKEDNILSWLIRDLKEGSSCQVAN